MRRPGRNLGVSLEQARGSGAEPYPDVSCVLPDLGQEVLKLFLPDDAPCGVGRPSEFIEPFAEPDELVHLAGLEPATPRADPMGQSLVAEVRGKGQAGDAGAAPEDGQLPRREADGIDAGEVGTGSSHGAVVGVGLSEERDGGWRRQAEPLGADSRTWCLSAGGTTSRRRYQEVSRACAGGRRRRGLRSRTGVSGSRGCDARATRPISSPVEPKAKPNLDVRSGEAA